MKAVIFNSGLGKRMSHLTENSHKSMVLLSNGETIFGRQLRLLKQAGITEFIVTTGPYKEQLMAYADDPAFSDCHFTFVENADYATTNYIYSMYLAQDAIESELDGKHDDGVLVIHGDLVFDAGYVQKILTSSEGDAAAVNTSLPQPVKDFKARVKDGLIQEVSVSIFDDDCYAFQPFYKLSSRLTKAWLQEVASYIDAGTDTVYAENAFNEILPSEHLAACSYEDNYVEEIDTPEDHVRVTAAIRLFDFQQQDIIRTTANDAHEKLSLLFDELGVERPFVVCGKGYARFAELKDLLDTRYKDSHSVFNDFDPNPTYEDVEKGVSQFRESNCDAILSLGGGSAIDTAKNIKAFSCLDPEVNYLQQPLQFVSTPHIAIPTTAGTGSESTRYAVLYYKGNKESVTNDMIVPDHALLDASLLIPLPPFQKQATLLDALSQAMESYWAVTSDETSKAYAAKAIPLVLSSYATYVSPEPSLDSAQGIMEASNLAGRAINLTATTAAHAMSYKITSLFGTPHGLAVALCLPHIWRYMYTVVSDPAVATSDLITDSRGAAYLKETFDELAALMGAASVPAACDLYEGLLAEFGLSTPEGCTEEQLGILVSSVNVDRLKNNPISLTPDTIESIYRSVFSL